MANTPFWYPCDTNKAISVSWINHENADGTRMAPGNHQKSILGFSCCINLNENPWVSWQLIFRCNISCSSLYAHCPWSCLGTNEENLVPSSWYSHFRYFIAFIRSPLICLFSRIKKPSSFLLFVVLLKKIKCKGIVETNYRKNSDLCKGLVKDIQY